MSPVGNANPGNNPLQVMPLKSLKHESTFNEIISIFNSSAIPTLGQEACTVRPWTACYNSGNDDDDQRSQRSNRSSRDAK